MFIRKKEQITYKQLINKLKELELILSLGPKLTSSETDTLKQQLLEIVKANPNS